MMTLTWKLIRETKNHHVYKEDGKPVNGAFNNEIYLPKGLPHTIVSEWDDPEIPRATGG